MGVDRGGLLSRASHLWQQARVVLQEQEEHLLLREVLQGAVPHHRLVVWATEVVGVLARFSGRV